LVTRVALVVDTAEPRKDLCRGQGDVRVVLVSIYDAEVPATIRVRCPCRRPIDPCRIRAWD
jgi:hypothetical protein